jgi:hypothetical protein
MTERIPRADASLAQGNLRAIPMTSLNQDQQNRISEIVSRFETTWRDGDKPSLERFLSELVESTARDELLRALLLVELEHRLANGETPRVEDYVARFPGQEHTIHAMIESAAMAPGRVAGPADLPVMQSAFPDYEVLDVIGRGAMGVVYRARHRELQKLAAIKIVFPSALLMSWPYTIFAPCRAASLL